MIEKFTLNPAATLRWRAEEEAHDDEATTRETLSPEKARLVFHDLRVHQIELEIQNEELRCTQEELEASQARYFDLYNRAPVGYFTISEPGLILEANLTAAELLGVERATLARQSFTRLIFIEDQDLYYRHRKQLFETGAPQVCELRMLRAGAPLFWARVEATAAQDVHGAPVCRATVSDITERKRAEEALEQAANLMRNIIDSSTDFIFVKDLNLRSILCNASFAKAVGKNPDDLTGKTDIENGWLPELVKGNPAQGIRGFEADDRAALSGKTVHNPSDPANVGGEVRIFDTVKLPLEDTKGRVFGVLGIARDVTERDRAEQERLRITTAMEQAAEAIVIADVDGNIEYVNPGFETITGYSRAEALGRNPRMLKSGKQDDAFYQRLWKTISSGAVWSGRLVNKRKDGTLYEEEATISPVLDKNARIVNYVAVNRDVTREVDLQRRLRQAQKLEAIGALASGIAHDFNNVLAAIIGYGQIAADQIPEHSPLHADLEQVLKAADRAADLVRQILMFSRAGEQERQPVAVDEIIKEALKLLRPSLPSTIQIRADIAAECKRVLADPTQIHQVLMNLCTNAYQAMGERGGILSLQLVPFDVMAEFAAAHVNLHEGPHVMLSVSDTGPGIAPGIIERIFEPFFTTKTEREGSGLGLSTVHGIVTAHGGEVAVYSELGQGTEFRVYLPCLDTEDRIEPGPEIVLRGGPERVLVVDDEAPLAKILTRGLKRFGYQPEAVTSGQTALAIIQDDPGLFDLVITDQTMPGITGAELAAEIAKIRSDLPVILMSGRSNFASSSNAHSPGVRACLSKPSPLHEIAQVVRRVLDEAAKE